MTEIVFFDQITDTLMAAVGGKGFNLGKLVQAGLPVPPGFVVTTAAYRRLAAHGLRSDPELVQAIRAAYAQIGGGFVAVRSSATAEDASDTSFAGQQETILGVAGEAVVDAIERCWQSLFSARAVAYRRRQQLDEAGLAMAVVVQQLVPAEVAGVLFTRDPLDATGRQMLVEAAWGLGESVVSGRVQPDRYTLDRVSGRVLDRQRGSKALRVDVAGETHVPPEQQQQFCLDDPALAHLADLGRQVEAFYGEPRDVEWAYAAGRFYVLQARPITVASAAEREEVRQTIIRELKAKADPRGTVWVRYNLSEVLPEPTPMTWAVVQRLLAADGGLGAMNRDLGAAPDPSLGSQSAFDLVAGRPMVNLSRLPRLQFAHPPFEYPFAEYQREPRKALEPQPVLNPLAGQGCLGGILRLPITVWKLARLMRTTRKQAANFPAQFEVAAASFAAAAQQALAQDWMAFDTAQVLREFETWVQRTLVDFARHSLKPTVFADWLWNDLAALLQPRLGPERTRAALGELSLGAAPPEAAHLSQAIRELSAGRLKREQFLARFGHRGTNEMELAQPRWSEVPEELDKLIRQTPIHDHPPAPVDSERIAAEAKLTGPQRDQFLDKVRQLRTFLGLREAGKHYLLMGYAVIRRALLELDRRWGLHGGIWFLTPVDWPRLVAGEDVSSRIAAARKRRQTELSLEVPPVLLSTDLEAIGRPQPISGGGRELEGIPLSAGVAEGPALVLTEPTAAPPEGGYVLVCPSTDPAWVPLFVAARGLVMETGGVLSHGAIVAREFGLPAVAGLPAATQQITTGQRLRVDGGRGRVIIVDAEVPTTASAAPVASSA
ncbi:MAG: PEP/pyruvate-binding domain-containing protein [Gemmataceae bacterium]|nr:PEP-utilizing enzyme [Gemmata sp.]MDW8197663.1 PEP/pyruvate-binding domain-containing protein [Gemmataceae bacterium]